MEKLDRKVIFALGTIATSGALFYFYTKSRKLTTLDLRNPDKTVSLPLVKVIRISEDTRIFRYIFLLRFRNRSPNKKILDLGWPKVLHLVYQSVVM